MVSRILHMRCSPHYADVCNNVATFQGLDMFRFCKKPKLYDLVINHDPCIVDALERLGFEGFIVENSFVETRRPNSFYDPADPNKNYVRVLTDEQNYNFIKVLAFVLDKQRRGLYVN